LQLGVRTKPRGRTISRAYLSDPRRSSSTPSVRSNGLTITAPESTWISLPNFLEILHWIKRLREIPASQLGAFSAGLFVL
jgi:hypothetical protein